MLLPAFGLPIRPTSAMTFSSSSRLRTSPSPPRRMLARSAVRGRFEMGVALAAAAAAGDDDLLADCGQVFERKTRRRRRKRQCPAEHAAPGLRRCGRGNRCRSRGCPRSARQCCRWASGARLSTPASATRMMLPPSPPSPPSGPPRGTNFSRRKLRQPLPPLPAAT